MNWTSFHLKIMMTDLSMKWTCWWCPKNYLMHSEGGNLLGIDDLRIPLRIFFSEFKAHIVWVRFERPQKVDLAILDLRVKSAWFTILVICEGQVAGKRDEIESLSRLPVCISVFKLLNVSTDNLKGASGNWKLCQTTLLRMDWWMIYDLYTMYVEWDTL